MLISANRHPVPRPTSAIRFQAEAPKPATIGQGQTLAPTPVNIESGVLGLIRKEESTARLKRDVWTVQDTQTQQTYSLFATGTEADLEALYVRLAALGEGTKVKVAGIAHKPAAMQRFPFIYTERLEPLPPQT